DIYTLSLHDALPILAVLGLTWVINDPVSKISKTNIFEIGGTDFSNYAISIALISFVVLLVTRTLRYSKITKHRMFAVMIIASLIIFFWAAFEQAGGSMSIFAKDYTNRVLAGNHALIFNIVDIIITVVPVAIISYVLFLLFRKTYKNYLASNLILGFSFLIIWGLIIWKIYANFNTFSYEINYPTYEITSVNDKGEETKEIFAVNSINVAPQGAKILEQTTVIRALEDFKPGQAIHVIDIDKKGSDF